MSSFRSFRNKGGISRVTRVKCTFNVDLRNVYRFVGCELVGL